MGYHDAIRRPLVSLESYSLNAKADSLHVDVHRIPRNMVCHKIAETFLKVCAVAFIPSGVQHAEDFDWLRTSVCTRKYVESQAWKCVVLSFLSVCLWPYLVLESRSQFC